MNNIQGTQHVLAVQDLKCSTTYYVEQLGFELTAEHPGWSFLKRETFMLMLGECPDVVAPKVLGDHAYFAYINVTNAETIFREFTSKSVLFRKQLTTEPWGMEEFVIETIDGHIIAFGKSIPT